MEYSYSIQSARRRLDDVRILYQFCSRTASNDYGEAVWHWRDQRGATFVRAYLDPQAALVAEGEMELTLQTIAGETCFNEAARCEREHASGLSEKIESETCIDRTRQLTRRACDLAGYVVAECSEIQTTLDRINAEILSVEHDPGWD